MIVGRCTECNEPCTGIIQDYGIGSYEFHGQRGVDVQLCLVSKCCEAEMRDEAGDLMYAEDYQDE